MRFFSALLILTSFVLTACSNATHIVLDTDMGEIEIEIYEDKAPISAADFLYYVDNGLYDGQGFYRSVSGDNDPMGMDMQIIQGGRLDVQRITAEIDHEPTSQTGLSHIDGAISIAREDVGTGSAAYFFISIGENKFLDHGGSRNPDGQGYAVFGQVSRGMEVVRAIQSQETQKLPGPEQTPHQYLAQPVIIKSARRN